MNKTVYLAGGCFWGMQAYFSRLRGIKETATGYANGIGSKTSYALIKATKHAEVIKVKYDDSIIRTQEIIDRFYQIINPFSLNKQGADEGEQYRTAIFYDEQNEDTYLIAKLFNDFYEKKYLNKSYVIIEKLNNFVLAEDYHQNYLAKNKEGYCHIDISRVYKPITDFSKIDIEKINSLGLTELEYNVLFKNDTEKPFSSELNANQEVGLYIDKVSKEPLFLSEDKYDAGCGWPSFTRTIFTNSLTYHDDFSIANMPRVEVRSSIQNAHLGHVFNDGPKDKGSLRYCINGASLLFIPFNKLEGSAYEKYLIYFKEYIDKFKN